MDVDQRVTEPSLQVTNSVNDDAANMSDSESSMIDSKQPVSVGIKYVSKLVHSSIVLGGKVTCRCT